MKNAHKISIRILFTSSLLLAAGCRQEEITSAVSDPQTDIVESAVAMVSGQADDAVGSSFALQSKSGEFKYAFLQSLLYGSAHAANCSRAVAQSCNYSTGVKTVSYDSCFISARGFSLSGGVTLTYSNNSCLLDVGDDVVRTYDHTISGPRGGAIRTTSELRNDYRGTQIGGGGKLSHTSTTGWTIDLLGKHKIGTRNGTAFFDVSARTTSPITLSGTLDRSGRTISSGVIEVNHNLEKFTATMTVNAGQPLVWNSLCCHPISGRLDATYSGSITGTGSITFNGCGTGQLSKDGSTRTLSFGYCE